MTRSTDPDALLKALRQSQSQAAWDMADEVERRRAAENVASPEEQPTTAPAEPPADLAGLKRSWTALLARGREVAAKAKAGDEGAVKELAGLRVVARDLRAALRTALGRALTDEEEARGFAP